MDDQEQYFGLTDCAPLPPLARGALQRARGTLHLAVKRRGAATVLADLRQDGCLKARFPRSTGRFEAVTLNSSGGVAGGDRLEARFAIGPGAAATFASQAAERFYRALDADPPARVRTHIDIAAGGSAEWLPQEAILFDRAALDRHLDIDMAQNAGFLGIESLVFGRAAMGERIGSLRLSDTIRVRRAGRLILHDSVRLNGEVAGLLTRAAIAGGAGAMATLVHVAQDAPSRLDALREAWAAAPAQTGASAWNAMLIGRIVAADAARLRAAIGLALHALRDARPLPRVWLC